MKPNRLFWLLWLVWMLLNGITAALMEIHADEAYYCLFGQYLDWGYYDHPPMVGLLAAIGNHVGFLRLMPILIQGLTLWLIWQMVAKERVVSCELVWNFYAVAAGLSMFLTAGFLLTPDAPLMLFVALFFYAYQRYVATSRSWVWAMVIGVSIAGMVYSKYMGVLVVVLTIMSHWQWIKDGRLWCAVGLALVLVSPHLYWLYTHHWATIQFHLVARHDPFEWSYLADYWPNQLVVFNPVVMVGMIIVGYKTIRERKKDLLETALGVNILGFLLFFWLMTLRGHVEPHWTMATSVAAIVLLTPRIEQRWIKILLWIMVGLCAVARLLLCLNCLPETTYLAHKQAKYIQWHEEAGEKVVVTTGSFQDASLYRYWQGEAILTHDMRDRLTQYDLLQLDTAYQGEPAYLMVGEQLEPVAQLQLTDRITITEDSAYSQIRVSNPYGVAFEWKHKEMPVRLRLATQQEGEWHYVPCQLEGKDIIPARGVEQYTIQVEEPIDRTQTYVYALENRIVITQNSK